MYVNSNGKVEIYGKLIETVNKFKYLGLELENVCKNPECILRARINKAN